MSRETIVSSALFLDASFRRPTPRTPVWFMRQAGRYLPEYRRVREKTDFLTLCKTPELAAEVTIQPVELVGVDAAIIFSDILVVPEAMGMHLIVEEGKGGPRFPVPVRGRDQILNLRSPDPESELAFVMDAIRLTRRRLGGSVPLIGFSGSPWTLATYMVEGGGSRSFRHIKELIYNHPREAHLLLGKLSDTVAEYLSAQAAAGAQALQIFDTWGGILSQPAFEEFSLRYIRKVVEATKKGDAPFIVFCKDCGHSLDRIAGSGCQVVSLDWTVDIGDARARIGDRVALQGNLDPSILYASPDVIRAEVRSVLAKFGAGPGHIFNLGHGVHPDTPVENVRAFVNAVKEESVQYHRAESR